MRNIEIKATINDPKDVVSRIKQLTDTDCVIIKQHDTFFKVAEGRLKLRKFEVKYRLQTFVNFVLCVIHTCVFCFVEWFRRINLL